MQVLFTVFSTKQFFWGYFNHAKIIDVMRVNVAAISILLELNKKSKDFWRMVCVGSAFRIP